MENTSNFLRELNEDQTKEAQFVYSLFSTKDVILARGDPIMSLKTANFPTIDAYIDFNSFDYSHSKIKDLTKDIQYDLVNKHNI